jgi:UMF1 family MFS transporter
MPRTVLGWSIGQIGVFGIVGAVTAMLALDRRAARPRAWAEAGDHAVSIVVLILVCAVHRRHDAASRSGASRWTRRDNASDQIFRLRRADRGGGRGAAGGQPHDDGAPHHPRPRDRGLRPFRAVRQGHQLHRPALIALATTISGSQRIGISPLIAVFLIGLILLIWVKPKGEMPA